MASLTFKTGLRQGLDRFSTRPSPLPAQSRTLNRTIQQNRPRFITSSAPPGPSGHSGKSSRFRLTPTTVILCCVPLLTGYLGVWQLQRLKWKLGLIEDVDRNLSKEPLILPNEVNAEALSDFAFRRVLLHGHFAQPLMLVGPRVYDGVGGYHLVQPFVRTAPIDSTGAPVIKKKKEKAFSFWSKDEEKDDVVSNDQAMVGGEGDGKMTTVLVNRGFVTTAQAQAYRENPQLVPLFSPSSPSPTSLSASPSAETKNLFIQALLRPPSEIKAGARPAFTPDNNIGNNEWFYIDLEAMKGWVDRVADGKIGTVQSVLMDEIYDGDTPATQLMQQGIPVGRPPTVELRNQHATYAATWLSLSALTSIMLFRLFWAKGKGNGKGVVGPLRR